MIEIKRPLEVGELRVLKNHYQKNTIQELLSELDTSGDIDFMLDLTARMLHLIKSRDGACTMFEAEEEIDKLTFAELAPLVKTMVSGEAPLPEKKRATTRK